MFHFKKTSHTYTSRKMTGCYLHICFLGGNVWIVTLSFSRLSFPIVGWSDIENKGLGGYTHKLVNPD